MRIVGDRNSGVLVFLPGCRRDEADAGERWKHQILQRVNLAGWQFLQNSLIRCLIQALEEIVGIDCGVGKHLHETRVEPVRKILAFADGRRLYNQINRIDANSASSSRSASSSFAMTGPR